MATTSKNNKQITMEMIRKVIGLMVDDFPPVQASTLEVRAWEPMGQIQKALEVSFKELADVLVKDVQVCNNCGNEIHFEKYAVYPNARIDLPENFGKPYILEQVWQFKPSDDEEQDNG